MIEQPEIVVTSADRLMSRIIPEVASDEFEVWSMSSPIPSVRIVGTYEVSHRQFVTLAVSDSEKYQIFHTADQINYTLVHTHDTEIFGIFNMGFGKSVFCATDGWWMTLDSGTTWLQIAVASPLSRVAVVAAGVSTVSLLIYATDQKIYLCEHSFNEFLEPLSWEEVYDASAEVPWYPAMAGGSFAVLAGVGSDLIRTLDQGDSWQMVETVDGVIKSITASDQSNGPIFLIEVEKDGISKLYWSFDSGDSLVPDTNRIQPVAAGSAVIPTGESIKNTRFVVVGRKPSGETVCTLVDSNGS